MEEFTGKREDLHITGVGKTAGGVYGKVQLDGMGSVGGDLDCTELIGNGSVSVKGSLSAQNVRINGNGSIDGPMDALDLYVGGAVKIKSDVRARSVKVGGRCRIDGRLTAKKIELSGSLKSESIQAEIMEVKGGFQVNGPLYGDTIEIKLCDRCEAREIYGNSITVKKKGNRIWEQLTFSIRPIRLFARILEGSTIDVEHTEAEVVRGNRVAIGPGCRIRLVEYRDELIQDPAAEIGEARRV